MFILGQICHSTSGNGLAVLISLIFVFGQSDGAGGDVDFDRRKCTEDARNARREGRIGRKYDTCRRYRCGQWKVFASACAYGTRPAPGGG